jgi:hypothetical protein
MMPKVVLVPSPLSQLFLSSKGLFIAPSNQHSLFGLTGTMALDPTFGSFTLLEPVSHRVNPFLW